MGEHHIETRLLHRQGASDYYELVAPRGYTDVVYQPATGWLGIANIYVEPEYRRRGLGKAMLRRTIELAEELDVRLIHAALISRESVDIFVSVFGEEVVTIQEVGTYGDAETPEKRDARAFLHLPLR